MCSCRRSFALGGGGGGEKGAKTLFDGRITSKSKLDQISNTIDIEGIVLVFL